jgi:hypothetical protein
MRASLQRLSRRRSCAAASGASTARPEWKAPAESATSTLHAPYERHDGLRRIHRIATTDQAASEATSAWQRACCAKHTCSRLKLVSAAANSAQPSVTKRRASAKVAGTSSTLASTTASRTCSHRAAALAKCSPSVRSAPVGSSLRSENSATSSASSEGYCNADCARSSLTSPSFSMRTCSTMKVSASFMSGTPKS